MDFDGTPADAYSFNIDLAGRARAYGRRACYAEFLANHLACRVIQCGEPFGPRAKEDLRLAGSERSARPYRIIRSLPSSGQSHGIISHLGYGEPQETNRSPKKTSEGHRGLRSPSGRIPTSRRTAGTGNTCPRFVVFCSEGMFLWLMTSKTILTLLAHAHTVTYSHAGVVPPRPTTIVWDIPCVAVTDNSRIPRWLRSLLGQV